MEEHVPVATCISTIKVLLRYPLLQEIVVCDWRSCRAGEKIFSTQRPSGSCLAGRRCADSAVSIFAYRVKGRANERIVHIHRLESWTLESLESSLHYRSKFKIIKISLLSAKGVCCLSSRGTDPPIRSHGEVYKKAQADRPILCLVHGSSTSLENSQ